MGTGTWTLRGLESSFPVSPPALNPRPHPPMPPFPATPRTKLSVSPAAHPPQALVRCRQPFPLAAVLVHLCTPAIRLLLASTPSPPSLCPPSTLPPSTLPHHLSADPLTSALPHPGMPASAPRYTQQRQPLPPLNNPFPSSSPRLISEPPLAAPPRPFRMGCWLLCHSITTAGLSSQCWAATAAALKRRRRWCLACLSHCMHCCPPLPALILFVRKRYQ